MLPGAVVLTGNTRCFSAGFDLSVMGKAPSKEAAELDASCVPAGTKNTTPVHKNSKHEHTFLPFWKLYNTVHDTASSAPVSLTRSSVMSRSGQRGAQVRPSPRPQARRQGRCRPGWIKT